VKSIKFLF